MGKQQPPTVIPGAVPGLYVPRSVRYFETHDNTKPFTDLDMLDYGELLRDGIIQKGQIKGRAQKDYEKQMGRFEGLNMPRSNAGAAVGGGVTTGAGLGAAAGSAIPGVGNAVGAAVGAIGGGLVGMLSARGGWRPTDNDRNRWAAEGGTLDQNREALMAEHGFGGQPSYGDYDQQIKDAAAMLRRKQQGGGYW